MKTCDDISELEEDHISLYGLFYAANTKRISYLSYHLDIKKCIEKIEEHRDKFLVYHDFLKQQLIKVENTKLIKEKFAKSLQNEGLKFDEYGVNKIFSYLDRNDIVNRLAKAYVPKKKASCEASEIKNLAKSQRGSRKSPHSLK